jgi:hypothetical protein
MKKRNEMINDYKNVTLKSKAMGLTLVGLHAGTCLFVPYATAEELLVAVDEVVEKGDNIATVGMSGKLFNFPSYLIV